ncbi:light-harvesting protein [Ovoidimarina sediminis]|uniref:light-harvesting protein n=1 Tax=Ovoidimarina sediminis TaxID=3079856 RepID=UPI00290B1EA9|nr:light-harvesting protein [Rhodophyticola sp. MJ-SS7]MDU8945558.1 light-harvesting protein [Rhodophyticola sp. MJ-SS7]
MNNAKMWLVVKPTVGIPLFLGGVAVASFAVHVAVLSKTNWYEDYLIGAELGSGEGMAFFNSTDTDDTVKPASYATQLQSGAQELTVILPDGTTTKAVLAPDVIAASAPLSVAN